MCFLIFLRKEKDLSKKGNSFFCIELRLFSLFVTLNFKSKYNTFI